MPESPCWPRDTLKDYLNGSADDQRLEAIESHLAQCPSCEQTVHELESNPNTLFMALREQFDELKPLVSQANSELESEPSVIQRVLESVKQFPGGAGASAGPLEKSAQMGVRQIGAYELLRPLGRGGMGLVMLARHSTLKKQVAVKILPSLIGDRPELVQRFQREIITAGQLNHPSIVHATDAGAEQGTHYLVMEYIDGLDLSRIARLGGPLSIADACEMMRQAALGLSYAHAQGVVHRDVKPSNLMLDTSARVKILDFGLAQLNLWEEAAVELTTVGQLMGTLDYMAPEQAERVGPVDYRADLYALGATLFRLLTGRAPLAASPNMTLLEKVRLLGSETPPLVSTLRDECPNDLVRLIQQLLSRDPATRPASAAHVAEALLPLCDGHNLSALLTRCREQAAAEPALDETPILRPLSAETPPVKPPRRSWLALACLAPLAVCAGIVILLETQKGQLVIESDVAGVKVNVLQDGKVYQQLQVQTGAQNTRLLADKYAIEIDGASDEVVIDQSNVEIRRGATVVARIRQKSKAARMAPDLSHVYDFIGVGDVVEKNKAASQSNLPQDLQIASLEVEAARARLDQQKQEADALKAELAQKTYEYEQVKKLYPKGLISELEYNEKRNSMEQAKSKLQKAEAHVSELAMMLSAKELALESKVNEAEIKNRDSSARASVAAQPMYAGKTLDQWLEVLRDLETKTRLTALPGIDQLGKNGDQQVLKRINEALTRAIIDEAKHAEWRSGSWRRVPNSGALGVLIDSVTFLNGNDAAFEVLKEGCLPAAGKITSETLLVLYFAYFRGMGDAVCDWLLSENRFQSLDRELAWSALTILEQNLNHQDAEFCQSLPKLVQDHPQLGLPAMLILWPPLGADRQELAGFEELIARAARAAFLDDDSSPTVIALSATRLAATTPLVEEFRSELVDKLKKRISELAKDRERLLKPLPVEPPGVKLSYQTGAEPIVLDAFDATRPKKRVNDVGRIVGSEMLGMLALAIRLSAVQELDEPLSAAAEPIFEEALPLAVAIQARQNGINWRDGLRWPFDSKQIAQLPDPLSSFSPQVWRAATIARTLRDLPDRVPLFHTQLLRLIVGHTADIRIRMYDKNSDQKIWIPTEAGALRMWEVDFDQDQFITRDEIVAGEMRDLSRAFIGDKLGLLGGKPEGFLTKAQAVPGVSEAVFEKIDTDSDGKITYVEGVDYLLAHPNAPIAAPAQQPQTSAPISTDQANYQAQKSWAERQINKYDKNKDGALTFDEWSTMIVLPKEGTDANGDGKITVEEFVAGRFSNASTTPRPANPTAPPNDPNIPKPDSSSTPIYEGK